MKATTNSGIVAIAGVIIILAAGCALRNPLENANSTSRLVARVDYNIHQGWQPRKVQGKDFWNILGVSMDTQPEQGNWGERLKKVFDTPLFKESGLNYGSINNIIIPGTNRVSISAIGAKYGKGATKKYLNLMNTRPDAPFFIMPGGIRPIFRLLRKFEHDEKGYLAWKKAHPNFIGCVNGETDNDFLSHAPWRNHRKFAKDFKNDPLLMKKIEKELPKPRNRREMTKQYLNVLTAYPKFFFNDAEKTCYMRAAHCYDCYFYEAGADMVWLETTNTAAPNGAKNYRHGTSLLFSRGAARQNKKNWGWYIAVFYNGYNDKGEFTGNNVPAYQTGETKKMGAGGLRGPGCGMSSSLLNRDLFLAYLSGATYVQNESWLSYFPKNPKNNKYDLSSPLAKVWMNWFEFTRKNPERGASYTPIALLVPFEQGYPNYGGKSWMTFKYKRPDWMIDAFMFTIMPHSPVTKKGDEGCLANSPYGDVFDVITPNIPKGSVDIDVLNPYKVAVMTGEYRKNEKMAKTLIEYVKNGGTLLMNIKQLNEFFPASFTGISGMKNGTTGKESKAIKVKSPITSLPENERFQVVGRYEAMPMMLDGAIPLLTDANGEILASLNHFKKGNVIISSVDWLVPKSSDGDTRGNCLKNIVYNKKFPFIEYFLKKFVDETLPMRIQGDIEYGVNKLSDGWLLYLINNKGVTKFTNKPQKLDITKTSTVNVALGEIKAGSIVELRARTALHLDEKSNSFSIDIPPGEVRIVKIAE